MAGRKPGPLVKIAEQTGSTKSLVRHAVACLQERTAISVPELADRETWKPDFLEILTILCTVKLSKQGFSTVHAADMVAAMMDATTELSSVYEDAQLTPFAQQFNEGLLQWFGEAAYQIYGRSDFYSGISFREFLWSAVATSAEFIAAGYAEASKDAVEAGKTAERYQQQFHKQNITAVVSPKCLVQFSQRFREMSKGYRCTVLVERPNHPWVLFGVSAGGTDIEKTIRYSAPFESLTTFWPRVLLSETVSIYSACDPPVKF